MLNTIPPPAAVTRPTPCPVMRATRPSLIDLRFKGDPWVVPDGGLASVRLGDYPLVEVAASPLDVPSLTRALLQVRLGQARRSYLHRLRKLSGV